MDGYIYEKKRSILKWNAVPGNYGTGVDFIDFIAPSDGSVWLAHLYLSATGFNTTLAWIAVQNGIETEYFRCDSNDPNSTQVSTTYFLNANSHLTEQCINNTDVNLERASVQYVKFI